MGFNGCSFYLDRGLIEGEQGIYRADGVFALQPFFDAAAEAGIYLIARPGPYINAEVAAGGFPGWMLRQSVTLRSDNPAYTDLQNGCIQYIGQQIAADQITNGGPVVLVQPENEYTTWPKETLAQFLENPQKAYMAQVEQQFRLVGITVPLIDNDNEVRGDFAPGSGLGAVDIYGIDAYPLRYDCADPQIWPTIRWPTNWNVLHQNQSPTTPFAVPEFQGGSGTGYAGVSQDGCNALENMEAIRLVYKHVYSFGVKLLNICMTFGGTNWGNLGYMNGDTSYDYGAAITEDRHVWREEYSEEKLQANFLKVSPAYLTAAVGTEANGSHVNTQKFATTQLKGVNGTNFYVLRYADWTHTGTQNYKLTVPTSASKLTIPVLGGHLSLIGRDSKILVTDYDVGGLNIFYSTADLFSWAYSAASGQRVVMLYGGIGETHEFAIPAASSPVTDTAPTAIHAVQESVSIVQWKVTTAPQTVTFGNTTVYMLWRNDANNPWSLELEASAPISNYSSPSKSSVIVRVGYLMRTASITGSTLHLTGNVNTTTPLELIYSPTTITTITFNNLIIPTTQTGTGTTAQSPSPRPS